MRHLIMTFAALVMGTAAAAQTVDERERKLIAEELAEKERAAALRQQQGIDYKAAVKGKMQEIARDPTSLLYEWGDPPRLGWTKLLLGPYREGLVGCIKVKGKNGFGGYGDWKWFIYVINPNTGVLEAHIDFVGGETFIRQVAGKTMSHDPGCPRGDRGALEL